MRTTNRRIAVALALSTGAATLDVTPLAAQQDEVLPDVHVTTSRLVGGTGRGRGGAAPGTATEAQPGGAGEGSTVASSSGIVTGTIITGASSSVITAQDIERSPGRTVQDILSREPGVQVTNLFGGVNGARSTVDMRGSSHPLTKPPSTSRISRRLERIV